MTTKNILIADDDQHLARALALRCEAFGIQTHVAHNAMTALTLAHAQPFDLICLDVNMPGGNGLSACEMITGSELLADTPVIILTGRHDEETIRRCHSMCAYYVLKCPDVWTRMEPLLRELLDLEPGGGGTTTSEATAPLAEVYRDIAHDVAYAQFDEARAASH